MPNQVKLSLIPDKHGSCTVVNVPIPCPRIVCEPVLFSILTWKVWWLPSKSKKTPFDLVAFLLNQLIRYGNF